MGVVDGKRPPVDGKVVDGKVVDGKRPQQIPYVSATVPAVPHHNSHHHYGSHHYGSHHYHHHNHHGYSAQATSSGAKQLHMTTVSPRLLRHHPNEGYFYSICVPVHHLPLDKDYVGEIELRFASKQPQHVFGLFDGSHHGVSQTIQSSDRGAILFHGREQDMSGFDSSSAWRHGRIRTFIRSEHPIIMARVMLQSSSWRSITPGECDMYHHYMDQLTHWRATVAAIGFGFLPVAIVALLLFIVLLAIKRKRARRRAEQEQSQQPPSAPSADDFEMIQPVSSNGYSALPTDDTPPPPPKYQYVPVNASQVFPHPTIPGQYVMLAQPMGVAPPPQQAPRLYPQVPQSM